MIEKQVYKLKFEQRESIIDIIGLINQDTYGDDFNESDILESI